MFCTLCHILLVWIPVKFFLDDQWSHCIAFVELVGSRFCFSLRFRQCLWTCGSSIFSLPWTVAVSVVWNPRSTWQSASLFCSSCPSEPLMASAILWHRGFPLRISAHPSLPIEHLLRFFALSAFAISVALPMTGRVEIYRQSIGV